ncbi:MAG: formylglycine-generating enzyme family protein, partial [Planctomycetota bacterium]
MSKKLVVVVCFTALVVHVHATASEVLMQCDVGGCGPVQAGWTGIAECGTTVDVNSTGIDVTLATGYPAACACRDTGGSGPLADVEADFLFADDAVSTPGGDFIITFSNLIAGERYWLLSYHNRSSEELSHIEGVVVTGAGDVTKPDRIAQDHPIMDDPAEVIFVAGPGDVSVRYIAPTEAEAGRGAQAFLNGFVLERMRLVAQFESSSSVYPESVVWAQLVVTLSTAQSEQVTVDYEVTGGTAEGNSVDYEIAPGPVVFEAGQTVRFIDIFIVEDGIDEEDETIEVTLTGVSDSNVGLGLRAGHTYTIIDPRPAAGFDSDSSKGMEEAVTVNTAVGLSEGPVETATVDYAVTGGSAEGSGVDYTLLGSGSLSFEPGETSKTIDVSIVGDDVQEGDETIELSLTSKSSNLKWGANREHTHTIIDDELGGAVYINSYGMKFIRIDAGDFMMGSGSGEWDERPVHKVTISQPFYILETEVTADHYRLFDPNYVGTGYVQNVSWHQAVAFAEWLSGQEGLSYRLPTEAEWEYACRAGTTTPFSSGYSPPSSGTPNPWGVINMHNSPKEWVRDWHGEYSYEDQVDPLGPDQGLARVVRGGGLDESGNYYVRSSNRAGIGPGFAGGYIGFRLVLGELPATPPEPYEAPFVRQG